jgi:hypothetical protein
MRLKVVNMILVVLLISGAVMAQDDASQEDEMVPVVVNDIQGQRIEGYLRLSPKEVTVTTKDKEEKSVPLKLIESIKVEKVTGAIPGGDQPGAESYYSVRLQNNKEIYTLSKKYTLHLNTDVGVMTRTLDPDMVQRMFQKDPLSAQTSQNNQPLIRDKSLILKLEIKF